MGDYDRSSKWLIRHHADAILRLAGVRNIVSWRPLPGELVQPGQLPDGVVEAELAGQAAPALFVLEIATYPEQRVEEQLTRDALLVHLARRELPEALVVVLRPKGRLRVPDSVSVASPHGFTRLDLHWRVVELWNVPAEDLLATNEPGLVPWVPLCQFEGPPEPVLERCREVIEREAPEEERLDLLAVTQVLARLRYNDRQLLNLLGGRKVMIESPLLDELREEWKAEWKIEWKAESVLEVLQARFGSIPDDVRQAVRDIQDEARLHAVLRAAARCSDLQEFRAQLAF